MAVRSRPRSAPSPPSRGSEGERWLGRLAVTVETTSLPIARQADRVIAGGEPPGPAAQLAVPR